MAENKDIEAKKDDKELEGDQDAGAETPEGEVVTGDLPAEPGLLGRLRGKRMLLIVAVVGVLLVIAGVGAWLHFGAKPKPEQAPNIKSAESKAAAQAVAEAVYYDLDEFIVNLDKGDQQPHFLKLAVTLQLPSQALADKIRARMPLIKDTFQVYLRELRSDDLQGAAAIYRLREELILRIDKIMYPDKVDDVLFKEILVQ